MHLQTTTQLLRGAPALRVEAEMALRRPVADRAGADDRRLGRDRDDAPRARHRVGRVAQQPEDDVGAVVGEAEPASAAEGAWRERRCSCCCLFQGSSHSHALWDGQECAGSAV